MIIVGDKFNSNNTDLTLIMICEIYLLKIRLNNYKYSGFGDNIGKYRLIVFNIFRYRHINISIYLESGIKS